MAFALSHALAPTSGNNLPQDSRHSATLFLQKPTGDIALLQIFQLNNTTLHSHQSAQCVCGGVVVVGGHADSAHSYVWTLVDVYIMR